MSLFVRQYMDAPNTSPAFALAPGDRQTIDLYALFTEKVLGISEATKSAAELTVEFSVGGVRQTLTRTETMRLYDSHALTWDDDRKAAAFVSPKDPTVMRLSKAVSSAVADKVGRALNANLLKAISILDLRGQEAARAAGLAQVTNLVVWSE